MSYSTELKKTLREISRNKKCCRRAFFYGEMLFLSENKRPDDINWDKLGYDENEELVTIKKDNFRCQSCKNSFLRGVFCAAGTVSDPSKSFHFEIKVRNEDLANELYTFMAENCVEMKRTKRGELFSLYLKKADDIEDVIHYLGAGKEAFEFANEKIRRDFSNLANRRNNFEVGNIKKTVNASSETIDAINILIKKGKLSKLPKGLEETAILRIENPYANLEELAALHEDRISKSGVNHRLKKLIELADED